MAIPRFPALCRSFAAVLLMAVLSGVCEAEPIRVQPHAQAGTFRVQRDPDKPIIAYYGGIGLRKTADGVWNGYRQSTADDVKLLVKRLHENGVTRAYASFQEEAYPSVIAPPVEEAPDFVALFCELAHRNNIEVYGDIACFANIVERCRGFLQEHPEAFTNSRAGDFDTHMLSPAHEHVRRFKRSLLLEYVQRYPVDGLALDFIRYPYYSHDLRVGFGKHGYDAPALMRFAAITGESELPAENDPRWIAVKADFVSQFIRELRADLRASGVDLPLAAFNSLTFGREDSLRTVHQDWLTWENERLIDEHAPMILMTFGMSNLIGATGDLVNLPDRKSMVMGPIFLAEGFDPAGGVEPTPDRVRDAARRLIKLGCDGLWFCRASEIEQHNLWPVVKEISQWSISEIRAQDFDPAYENLLVNGAFEQKLVGWESSGNIRQTSADGLGVTVLDGSADAAGMAQTVRFVKHPYLAPFALEVVATPAASSTAQHAELRLDLQYANGQAERHTWKLDPAAKEPFRRKVNVLCDFKQQVLTAATVKLIVPAGDGSLTIQRIELLRDPRATTKR